MIQLEMEKREIMVIYSPQNYKYLPSVI